MNYIKVKWIHQFKNEPIELYSELDDNRNETRKIEVFNDDQIGYATLEKKVGDTRIPETSIPELEEIALDEQFKPFEISKNDFEKAWQEFVLSKKYKIKYNPEKFTELGK